MRHLSICLIAAMLAGPAAFPAQMTPGRIAQPIQPQSAPPEEAAPPQGQPATPAEQPATPGARPATPPLTAAARPLGDAPFTLNGASLTEMIDVLARQLKINYILDPSVKGGSVTIYTYGEVKSVDLMPLMHTILRINGLAMVQVGDFYRIVPIKQVSVLPLSPTMDVDPKTLPDDERMVFNFVFLKYATAAEIQKLVQPFLGEGAQISSYDPANLLMIEDNSRSMKRTMELISMFDSDSFAGQRVKLFDIQNSRPSDLVKDLNSVFKAYALTEKASPVQFIPVDRINTLIAVAPNPGVFVEVKSWIDKLDVAAKVTAGSVELHYYRLKYGMATTVAVAVMGVLSGNPMALAMLAMMGSGTGMGGMGMGGMGMGGYGGAGGYGGMGGYSGMGGYGGAGGYGMGGYGAGGYGMGGYGTGGYGTGGYGMGGYGMGGYGAGGYGMGGYASALSPYTSLSPTSASPLSTGTTTTVTTGGGAGLTGSYLGQGTGESGAAQMRGPIVIPNPLDNTILVRSTPQEWEQIKDLLTQIDVSPRQVLIDAKIYEVDLTGAFSFGVNAYLEAQGTSSRALTASSSPVSASGGGLNLSVGALVLRSKEIVTALAAAETNSQSRLISSPSIIATDSIPAMMNVGQQVPVLTSQAVGGVQNNGTSLFTNTISNVNSGVTLSITPRINSSGVVTMEINENVSSPIAPGSTGIQSDSFSQRTFSTQVTVQDGDTIAIGGFIQEQYGNTTTGIPGLSRIPWLGSLFGSKSVTKGRTELVILITPRVIYDTNQMADAADEVKTNLKKVQKLMKKDE
jgi:general secretion pathway protein D